MSAMTDALILATTPTYEPDSGASNLLPSQLLLKQMVLDSVVSAHSKRNYGKALDDLFLFAASQPLTRALLMEWRSTMEKLSPSTVNVRLSAFRKLVSEARKNGMIGTEEAANLSDIPNIRQQGTRLGNWLTREQAKELLAVPDRSTLKGKRDYAILALLVGCALRRRELAYLNIEDIQMREGRWVIVDLRGKGGRIRLGAHGLHRGHDRGYRYVQFEAGAIGHRLYLAAEALGLGATGIGAFYDDEVHRHLNLVPPQGQVVYQFAIGYPVPTRVSRHPMKHQMHGRKLEPDVWQTTTSE